MEEEADGEGEAFLSARDRPAPFELTSHYPMCDLFIGDVDVVGYKD